MIEKLISVAKWPSNALVLPRLQAHRGYWQEGAQENTMEAFRAAKKKGAVMFECDLRLSKDQVPMVFHDEDLARVAGSSQKIKDLTAEEIKRLAGAPSLREIITDPSIPRFMNLELKSKQVIDDPLERKVAEVVVACKAQNRVLFSSFNPMSLYRISLHLPSVPRALLVTPEESPDNSIFLRKMWLAPFFSFHCLNLHHSMLTPESMNFWQQKKVPIVAWTVNGTENIQHCLKMGAISVISDSL